MQGWLHTLLACTHLFLFLLLFLMAMFVFYYVDFLSSKLYLHGLLFRLLIRKNLFNSGMLTSTYCTFITIFVYFLHVFKYQKWPSAPLKLSKHMRLTLHDLIVTRSHTFSALHMHGVLSWLNADKVQLPSHKCITTYSILDQEHSIDKHQAYTHWTCTNDHTCFHMITPLITHITYSNNTIFKLQQYRP